MVSTRKTMAVMGLWGAVHIAAGCGPCACPAATAEDTARELPPAPPAAAPQTAEPAPAPAPAPAPEKTAETDGWWWEIPYPDKFDASAIEAKLDVISVKGNRFVDAKGKPVVFQGVSIADPDKLTREGHFDRKLFEVIKAWGANVVRVPVHPAAWRGLGKTAYLALLDNAVRWATELDLYLIIDWHSIGNLVTGMYQHPMYQTTKQETFDFWRTIAFRYQGISTVAFYELFNEPTVYNGNLGKATWGEWKTLVEAMIDIIYSHDKQVIPLVAGFNWAYDLEPVAKTPIDRKGIGYVSHPYPQKVKKPFEKKWDKNFGFIAETYPLFVTEIGYMREGEPGAHVPVMDDGTYGPIMTDYLKAKGASWVAWCFHPHWSPQLISDWDFTPTESGAHFQKVMQAR